MLVEYKKANLEDAKLLIDIYNTSFYSDYVKYGECPGYGKTKEMMEQSIMNTPKFIITCDGIPVGVISCDRIDKAVYEIGCLCIIPAFQGKGIGTRAVEYVLSYYNDWKKVTLITPVEKKENVKFYTEKCFFQIESIETGGNVKVYRFVRER